ncbi:hypothetical protein BSZ14_15215 [Sphingomonas sp. Sph1(2015)]|jgi:hypothetical protein|uniref:hypothetical protein n=1 Tax=Sphingomonas sp. Sph1(2015) TaxID=1628084 RepID=UPI000975413E|nr:hypothetical protein [Sphingomonas sp. Sph1(2015)]OMJ31132.1 hypothetical protein BSZ14_15215 [Sphingomonas sp. Sph1(2015)]
MTLPMPILVRTGLIGLAIFVALPASAQVAGRTATTTDRDSDPSLAWSLDPTTLQQRPVTSSMSATRPGATARSSVGQAGQRQQRERELGGVGPGLRIQNRIQNRIQTRLSLRIDPDYDPGATQRSPFAVANDQVRSPTARVGRRSDNTPSR